MSNFDEFSRILKIACLIGLFQVKNAFLADDHTNAVTAIFFKYLFQNQS